MDYEKNLWDLGNAITAFAVLQALAFAYYFKDANFPPQVGRMASQIKAAIVGVTVSYILAVVALNHVQLQLIHDDLFENIPIHVCSLFLKNSTKNRALSMHGLIKNRALKYKILYLSYLR